MDNAFMDAVAAGLGNEGLRVLRFEFPYMQKRRVDGKRRPPDREAVLLETWREAIAESGVSAPFIGGKSMGGRMASMIADESAAKGLVCLGYPFHPPGNPAKTRTAHLEGLRTPALIVQGTNDPFGTREDVAEYQLSRTIRIQWIEGGNHDLQARGVSRQATFASIVAEVAQFVVAT
jgi:hypothetical protein